MISCLLLACSKRKCPVVGRVPALELYDGGPYRVVRKLRRERGLPANLHILILSARYGLIGAEDLIETYDQLMDETRAQELSASVGVQLDERLLAIAPTQLFVDLGRTYRLAIASSGEYRRLLQRGAVDAAEGPPGVRLGQLRTWLLARFGQLAGSD
jgi:hypothetical protein